MTPAVRPARPLPAVEVTARFVGPIDGTLRRLMVGLPAPVIIATPRVETGYLLSAYLDRGRIVGWRLAVCDPDRADGQSYDLPADLGECECADHLTRHHRRIDGKCKHEKGVRDLLAQLGLPV